VCNQIVLGNVLDGVLKYQKRLSQPLGESQEDNVIFTPLYLDGSGLGMMTTISTAVFSTKNNSETRELIGVAGMDIVVSLLQQQYPVQKMGVFGHAFAINNNGLFLMHPKFKDQYGYLPDPATVYLDEVEFTIDPSKSVELKQAMINNETGCMNATADWLFPKNSNRRVVRLNNTFCYQPMNNTPFFAGVSMPIQNTVQMIANRDKAEHFWRSGRKALDSTDPHQIIEIASWSFCEIQTDGEKNQPASNKYYPTSQDLFKYLSNIDNTSGVTESDVCDQDMLLTLLLSASVVSNFTNKHWSVENFRENGIVDAYVITSSGFMSMLTTNLTQSKRLDRDIFEEIRFTHPASFYHEQYHDQLTFSVNIKTGRVKPKPIPDVDAAVAVGKSVYTEQNKTLLAVVGMTVSSTYMQSLLEDISANSSIDCSIGRCYLIDENGYIVTSNQGTNRVGYFIGNFEGELVRHMVRSGLFEVRRYNDTQAECPQRAAPSGEKSPANILKTFYYHFFEISYGVVSQLLTILWWMFISLLTVSEDTVVFAANSKPRNESCTKEIKIYLLVNQPIKTDLTYKCSSECNQTLSVQSLSGTNLAHVVVEDTCFNTTSGLRKCPHDPKDNEPKRIDDLSVCEQPVRYRRALPVCYRLTGVDKLACNYTNEHKESNIYIYIIIFVSVCFAIIIALVFNMYFKKYLHGRCC